MAATRDKASIRCGGDIPILRAAVLGRTERRLALWMGGLALLGAVTLLSAKALWGAPVQRVLEALFSPDGHLAHPWPATLRLALAPAILIGVAILTLRLVKAGYGARWHLALIVLMPLHLWAFGAFPVFFEEDGIAEYGSALLAVVGAAAFLRGAERIVDVRVLVAILLFLFAMEEISWGQRILGIETETVLPVANYQNEINLHNFLNPVLDLMAAVLFALCLWVAIDGPRWPPIRRLPGLSAVCARAIGGRSWALFPAMVIVALLGVGEVYEEWFSLLACVLGWQVMRERATTA